MELSKPSPPIPIMRLPVELHTAVSNHLPFPDNINLKMTSRYFWNTIDPLGHAELLHAEGSEYARLQNLFACKDCLRLRYGTKFANKMTKRKRSVGGRDADMRFCVDCGISPKSGLAAYCRGNHVVVQRQVFVRCIECDKFRGSGGGMETKQCRACWDRAERPRRALEERKAEHARRSQRAARNAKRAAARQEWGSDRDISSDGAVISDNPGDHVYGWGYDDDHVDW